MVLSVGREHLLRLTMKHFFLPLKPQKKEIIFLPENTCAFFETVSTQRDKKQIDAPYELGSLQMLPCALGPGTGRTAVLISLSYSKED